MVPTPSSAKGSVVAAGRLILHSAAGPGRRRTAGVRQARGRRGQELEDARTVLYISYDGMTDPLGQSQVLPYLTGLAARGHRITLLSAEKTERFAAESVAIRRLCDAAGIDWQPIRYHRSPLLLSGLYDAGALERQARRLHRRRAFDIVHCRGYIPALVGLRLKRRLGIAFLFDMRGFWADERAEAGSWPRENPVFSAVYRFFKYHERAFIREADAIVSLTKAGRDVIVEGKAGLPPSSEVSVIPCCVDFDHFADFTAADRAAARRELGIPADRPVLVYVGSLGGNYMLGEMMSFFRGYRRSRPGALFLFITREDPGAIVREAGESGVARNELLIRSAKRDEVPRFIAAADAGVAFKQASFSAKACSPTKLGEMLAVGIPVVANAGVGDVEEVLCDTAAGVVVTAFDEDSMRSAASELVALRPDPRNIREGARRWFNLKEGITKYHEIYAALGKRTASSRAR